MTTTGGVRQRLRRGWEYYRRYTKRRTGIHAAATAALTGFGLLAYYEQWFVFVAIVAYLAPPIYLYLVGDDLADAESSPESADSTGERRNFDGVDADSDSDGIDADGIDADADGIDADSDSDSDDGDADSDSDDGDTDSDSDDGDTDSDG